MIKADFIVGSKYRLVELIGEGGMGSVWRAHHLTLGRPVAIKFIRTEMNSPEVAARFLREARATASVRHRNVIDVIDYGKLDDGVPYIVMELLEGQSLGARLAAELAPTVSDIVEIVASTLSGLAAVHDAQIIHRDLKPENVFLAHDPDGVVPKLVDFGISRASFVYADSQQEAKLTRTGSVVGTPYYMSPEQVRGVKDLDGRTDLYSVGVILYEALTGRLPFQSDTLGALMVSIATEEAQPVFALRPEVGAALSDVVKRAMARDREQRFKTSREMRQALLMARAFVNSRTASRPPPQHPELPETRGVAAARDSLGGSSRSRSGSPSMTPFAWSEPGTESSTPPRRATVGLTALAAAIVILVGGGLALVLTSQHPEPQPTAARIGGTQSPPPLPPLPPSTVTVRLRGVPSGATIRVDGDVRPGPDLLLSRDQRVHVIEVSAPGRATWRMGHPAVEDAEYAVRLDSLPSGFSPAPTEPVATSPSRPPRSHPSPARPPPVETPAPPPTRPGSLLNDPGF